MLKINCLSIQLKKDQRYLLKDFNLIVNNNDKVALIGEEGNGKSTLIKAIVNPIELLEYADITGTVEHSGEIGYLEQSLNSKWNEYKIIDYFLIKNIDDDINYELYEFYQELIDIFVNLGLNPNILETDQVIKTLSGGEKVKLQLAKTLFYKPSFLLLDEPTNDLDINTLEWLEKFINNQTVPVIFVSHDESLLENTANMIVHLEQLKKKGEPKHTILRSNYKDYINKRQTNILKQTEIAKKEKENFLKQAEKLRRVMDSVEHKQANITRADPHGGKMLKRKMKSLKSQEKRLENTQLTQIPIYEEAINLYFDKIVLPKTKKILDLNLKELTIKNKILSKNIKLEVMGSEKIVIIGKNGCGKTTLINKIYNEIKKGDLKVGFMPQNYDEMLNSFNTILDFLKETNCDESTIRSLLGNLRFTTEEMTNQISDLSNGQKAKLFLLKQVLNNAEVLILDEPTRNLSPLTSPVVRKMLKDYQGAIISISHDRKYIKEVCSKVYELSEEGIISNIIC